MRHLPQTIQALILFLAMTTVAMIAMDVAPQRVEAGYTPKVQDARQWARDHVNKGQWPCLDKLWDNESGWSIHATTPRGASPAVAAYGIPQSLPGIKMAKAEHPRWGKRWDDWVNDGLVQVYWGLHYIWGRHGTMCRALRFQNINGWY